ncbi:MAG: GFA family protein [Parvibaculaceae bacterium]
MLYRGSCHCGRVSFEVEGTLEAVVSCNCSICARKGALLWAVPRAALKLDAGKDALSSYTFNRHAIVHRFCPACGIHPFAEDAGEGEGRDAYVNVRCLEGVDLGALQTIDFDGRSL